MIAASQHLTMLFAAVSTYLRLPEKNLQEQQSPSVPIQHVHSIWLHSIKVHRQRCQREGMQGAISSRKCDGDHGREASV